MTSRIAGRSTSTDSSTPSTEGTARTGQTRSADLGRPSLGTARVKRVPERRPVGQRGEHAALDRFPDTAE